MTSRSSTRSRPSELAKIVSAGLSAPLLAFPAFVWLSVSIHSGDTRLSLLLAFVFATLWPLLALFALVKSRRIPDMYVEEREKRTLPFLVAMAGYGLGGLLLWLAVSPSSSTILMFCYGGNTTAFLVMSLKWKPSVHASGVTGPMTVLALSVGPSALAFGLLLLPVAWARTRLGAHTWSQVATGALVTIPLTAVQYLLYARLL